MLKRLGFTQEVYYIELLGFISTVLSVAGVLLNNYRLWPCFVLWLFSNALCAWIHYKKRVWSLLVRDIIFLGLAVQGLILWT